MSDVFPSPRIDEHMHVLTGRAPSKPTLPLVSADQLPRRTTSASIRPQPRIRASTIPTIPAAAPATKSQTTPPGTTTRSDVTNILRHLRPAPIPPNAPPAIIAGCIAEVLGIPDVHGVLDFLESDLSPHDSSYSSRPGPRTRSDSNPVASISKRSSTVPSSPHADMLPRLAIKAKSLYDDNRRMHSEIQDLKADKVDLEAQLKRVEAAMQNMVRVAEIMNVRSRFTPPSSPQSDDVESLNTSRDPLCPTCSPPSLSPDRTDTATGKTRWSMQLKPLDLSSDDDEGNARLTILPPPRRISRVPSTDSTPRPTSIHLGDADCGVSLNRFRTSEDDECSDDETEMIADADVDECSKELNAGDLGTVKALDAGDVAKANKLDEKIYVHPSGRPVVEIIEMDIPSDHHQQSPNAKPTDGALSSDLDTKHSHRTSVRICEWECDSSSITTTDTPDGGSPGGDVIVVKTGFSGTGEQRMSMSLDQQNVSLMVKMVTTTLTRSKGPGGAGSGLSSSTLSIQADNGHDVPNVDEQDVVADALLLAKLDEMDERQPRREPEGYPWW